MKKFIGFFLLFLSLWGCSARKPNEIPENIRGLKKLSTYNPSKLSLDSLRFKKEETYGKIYETDIPYFLGPMIVVDHKGRVFIDDQWHNLIRVYDADGSELTNIGRKGRGPGEFEDLVRLRINNHYLYAYDFVLKRISVFSLKSLKLLNSISLKNYGTKIPALRGSPMLRYFVQNDSTIMGGFLSTGPIENKSLYRYFFLNQNGEIISDEILQQKSEEGKILKVKFHGRTWILHSPFGRESLITVSNTGNIYTAWTNQFLIKEYDPNGKYQRSVFVRFKKVTITLQDLAEVARQQKWPSQILEQVRNSNLPKAWPALHSMLTDNTGRLWISTIVNDSTKYKWWVLNKSGKPVAFFRWPKNEPIEYIRNGSIYVKTIDDLNTIRIVRYGINR